MSDNENYRFPCPHCGHQVSELIVKLKAGAEMWCTGPTCGRQLEYEPKAFLQELGRVRRGLAIMKGGFVKKRNAIH
jgi:transcription elongation factor Elf1